MTDAAIISGSLVDVRNVGTHKSVKLTIHVPEEYAMRVVAAFGWPTMVTPIAVAIARLDERKVMPTDQRLSRTQESTTDTPPRLESDASAGADKPKKSPAQIAGYLCTTVKFQKFLRERFLPTWLECSYAADGGNDLEIVAARCVRQICRVASRGAINSDNADWSALLLSFRLWENHPELEDA